MGERRRAVNWPAVDRILTKRQRAELAEACRLLGADPARWWDVPALRAQHLATAPLQLAEQLVRRGAVEWSDAVAAACLQLGFAPESFARRTRQLAAMLRGIADPDAEAAEIAGHPCRIRRSGYDDAA